MITIAITNQKGGVGKTTTAINLSTALAAIGKKVLLVDIDPQGNATSGLNCSHYEFGIYDVLVPDMAVQDVVKKTEIPNLDMVCSSFDLSGAELEIAMKEEREYILRKKLKDVDTKYDLVIIDCPPSLNLLTLNAIVAADRILIPMQCEYFSLEGLSQLLHVIKLIKENLNSGLSILGVAFMMFDKKSLLAQSVVNDVKSNLGTSVFETIIPRNIKLSESPSHGKPALIYDINCVGSQSYIKLAGEVIKRLRNEETSRAG